MDVDKNKRIVLDFYELAFNKGLPQEAADLYLGPTFSQHNPYAGDGVDAFVRLAHKVLKRFPLLRHEAKRLIAEDDLVVVHGLMTTSPEDRGTVAADIFRIGDGRIVEHWAVYEAVPVCSSFECVL